MNLIVNILYYIFIFPLEWIFNFILINTSFIGLSYSLLILSLISQLISHFLQKFTAKIESKEKYLKCLINEDLDKIKGHLKGEELFKYTEEIYKKHHYNPLLAFRSSASLFIIIPLFIAAYQVLSNNPLFEGQDFFDLFVLTKADHLLFGFNILPMMMFIFNLYSIFLSTGKLFNKENTMFLVLSVFFLVYLYNKESVLLVYWTTNNILLCLKLLLIRKKGKYVY